MHTVSDLYREGADQQIAVACDAHLEQPLEQLMAASADMAIDTAGALTALSASARAGGQVGYADLLIGLADQLADHAAAVTEARDNVTDREHIIDAALAQALRDYGVTD